MAPFIPVLLQRPGPRQPSLQGVKTRARRLPRNAKRGVWHGPWSAAIASRSPLPGKQTPTQAPGVSLLGHPRTFSRSLALGGLAWALGASPSAPGPALAPAPTWAPGLLCCCRLPPDAPPPSVAAACPRPQFSPGVGNGGGPRDRPIRDWGREMGGGMGGEEERLKEAAAVRYRCRRVVVCRRRGTSPSGWQARPGIGGLRAPGDQGGAIWER